MAGSITLGTEGIKAMTGASAPPVAEGRGQGGGLQRRFEVRCSGCGYGGIVESFPDRCPMCRGTGWETVDAPGSLPPSWVVER